MQRCDVKEQMQSVYASKIRHEAVQISPDYGKNKPKSQNYKINMIHDLRFMIQECIMNNMPELPEVDPIQNLPSPEVYILASKGRLYGARTIKEDYCA